MHTIPSRQAWRSVREIPCITNRTNSPVWRSHSWHAIYNNFSNSLIIHQVKTKEITTVKEVWIPGLNSHRFWRFYFSVYVLVFVSIIKVYQTLETVFRRLSKHLEFPQKYSAARRIFNSLLGVLISRWNTVSRVWYITRIGDFVNASETFMYTMKP